MGKNVSLWRLVLLLMLFPLLGGALSCTEVETRPRAWIDFPRDGAQISPNTPVNVSLHAYAREGVAEVVLSVNGEPYRRHSLLEPGVAISPTLTFTGTTLSWVTEEPGDYLLQVTAYDTRGEASNPASVAVRVVGQEVPLKITETPTPTSTPTSTPTVTPTGTPTVTPTGTPTSTPTSTPTPTATPTVAPEPVPPAEVSFWVDQDSITSGECTLLHWDVEHATGVYLNGEGVAGHDTRQVCPTTTTTYDLHVEAPAGDVDRSVTVTVKVDTTPPPAPSPQVPADGLSLPKCVSSQTLAWLPVSDPSGILGYYVKLQRRASPTEKWQSVGEWGPVSGKQFDVPVECGWYYRWAVRAQDGAGNYSDWSAWYHFSVPLM